MPIQDTVENNRLSDHRFSIKGYSKTQHLPLWQQEEETATHTGSHSPPSPVPALRSRNKVFSVLPENILARLTPHIRRVLIHQDEMLHQKGQEIKYVYFIENGMVSLVVGDGHGAKIEAAVIGSEGMVGVLSAWENCPSFHSAIVQIPGKALRLPLAVFQEEWKRNPYLQEWGFNYANLLMAQVSQTALCGRLHTVEERLNRWLLTSRDRVESDTLELTHEHIAQMLGTRRPSITIALGALQQAGMIECKRGQILIKDGQQLEKGACECYRILQSQFQNFQH